MDKYDQEYFWKEGIDMKMQGIDGMKSSNCFEKLSTMSSFGENEKDIPIDPTSYQKQSSEQQTPVQEESQTIEPFGDEYMMQDQMMEWIPYSKYPLPINGFPSFKGENKPEVKNIYGSNIAIPVPPTGRDALIPLKWRGKKRSFSEMIEEYALPSRGNPLDMNLPNNNNLLYFPIQTPSDLYTTMTGKVPIRELPEDEEWKIQSVSEDMKEELKDSTMDFQVFIRGENYSNWLPKRLYTSHKYHMKLKMSRVANWAKDEKLSAKVSIRNPAKNIIYEPGMAIKSPDHPNLEPALILKGERYVGEFRFQLLLSSYKLEKGCKKMQFHVEIFQGSKAITTALSPTFEVFARKSDHNKKPLSPAPAVPLIVQPPSQNGPSNQEQPQQQKRKKTALGEAMAIIQSAIDKMNPQERQMAIQILQDSTR